MRQLKDWVEAFVEYTEGRYSPKIFRKWAGISAVAAGLQRRSYTRIMGRDLYPNLFILLVADPGVGKSNAILAAREVIREDKRVKLAPQRVTKEAFYEELESAQVVHVVLNGPSYSSHSMTAMIDEFGVFVRRGDLDFMADLADLFDCPDPFQYKTKHSGKQDLSRTWFNFISGCTPAWMKESFTEIALEQGFPARIIAVYSTEKTTPNLWSVDEQENRALLEVLRSDFAQLLEMEGEFVWDPDAANAFQAWMDKGMPPYPQDPRLRHYCTRRVIHIAKLSMVLSASRSNEMLITLEDFKRAQATLLEAELHMHEAYAAVGKNPYFAAVEGIIKFAVIEYRRTKKPILEHKLRRVLEREVPYQLVQQILDQIVAAKRLDAQGESPNRYFSPPQESDDEGT